ncbi:MAG: hypothetical protein IKP69_04715 [Oscillospiraceae bacterium]|nr:hypothetical protein [Oscillospiraceae bacterium]
MGLDMYLYCRNKGETELPDDEIYYWRKANQIRQWIVSHTGYSESSNITTHVLTKEHLENLLSDCKKVLKNPELAPMILPTSEGFFFGGTRYDESYLLTVEETAGMLESLIPETNFVTEEIVYWEWW